MKAGDRLPYFLVDGQSIFDKLKEPKFHVLLFSTNDRREACEEFSSELVDCHVIPITERVKEIFDREDDFSVFLRPDNYIAFMSSDLSLRPVEEYLTRMTRI